MSKRGKLFAIENTVVLRQIDDNVYNQEDITKTDSSRFVTDQKQITSGYEYKGKVLAVGKGLEDQVSVGDIIHHGPHGITVFTFDGESLGCLPKFQISAIEKFED